MQQQIKLQGQESAFPYEVMQRPWNALAASFLQERGSDRRAASLLAAEEVRPSVPRGRDFIRVRRCA